MVEEEFLKCRTDCVYFLASPFTCKKGEECEYRHCEAARLNPRDCWYWLYGSCSNITCRFRHPPLDVHNEGSTEDTYYVPHQPSVPATKTTVPCYFYYYNGLCGKGDSCPYLHEPANSFEWCQKVGNSVSDAAAPPAGNKASGISDLVPKHAEKDRNPSEIATVTGNNTSGRIDIVPKHTGKHPSLSELVTIAGNNTSVRSETVPKHAEQYPSLSEMVTITDETSGRCKTVPKHADKYPSLSQMVTNSGSSSQVLQIQPARKASIENLLDQYTPVRTYVSECEETTNIEDSPKSECEPSLGSDQSSDELIHRSIVRDEWWESSPGFDVLVDEQTQGLAYEDDLEYIYPYIESEGEGDPVLVKYGFETNSNEGEFFNYGLYEPSEHLDCELRANHQKISQTHSQNRNIGNIDSRKRKLCSLESPVDLRDHLRRKRMIDGHLVTHDLRHDLMQRRYDRTERSVRYRPNQHLYETNGMLLDRRTSVTATNLRGRLRYSQKNDFRIYNGMRRRYPQQRLYLKRDKYAPQLTVVAKSRSLAKVVKGKRPGYYSKNESVNFEGPKPLSEILKDKKKTVSCKDDTLSGFC